METMKEFSEQLLVLAIDDEPAVLDNVAAALSQSHFACQCCTTANEALSAARTTPPDMILCDASLEGEGGMDLCERIRQLPGLDGVPVMFLSGAQLPDIIRRSHAAGGVYCLRKPFDPVVLLELIDQAMAAPAGISD
jgi:CheY-like chemotaxis protein